MDDFALVIGIIIVVAALVVTIYIAVKQRINTNNLIRNNEINCERQKRAACAIALVLHSRGGITPVPSSRTPMTLTLEVTPPDGKPYRATTQWSVDVSALFYVAQGQEIAVKIDSDDSSIIYPNATWATYIG